MATLSKPLLDLSIKIESINNIYKLTIGVSRYQNIQAEIFVFKRDLSDGNDYFSHVANTGELTSYPKNIHEQGNVFFLVRDLVLEFEKYDTLEDTLKLLSDDVNKLVNDWDKVRDKLNQEYNMVFTP